MITVRLGVFKALEHHHPHPIAQHRATGPGIKGTALAVARIDKPLQVLITSLRKRDA